MKVDIYQDRNFQFVVPTGTNLKALKGDAEKVAEKLTPEMLRATIVEITSFYKGDLLGSIESQIATAGMGLAKTSISFSESVVSDPTKF